MKLAPGERSILATFPSRQDAISAADELRATGFTEVQIDQIGSFGHRAEADFDRPAIAGKDSSLAGVTLNPTQLDDNSRILMAASPEASGMAGPVTETQHSFLVTVLTHEDRLGQVVSIIEEHGGKA